MSVHTSGVAQNANGETPFPQPLQPSGALEQFAYEDITPVIGREFPHLNVVDDLLNSPNADAMIRDLAIASKIVKPSPSNDRSSNSSDCHQSLSAASFSSVHRTISQKTSKDNSSVAWVS